MPPSFSGGVAYDETSKSFMTSESVRIFDTRVIDKPQEEEKKGDDFVMIDEGFAPKVDSMSILRFIKGKKSKKYEISPSGK